MRKLSQLLIGAGEEFDNATLERIAKHCHQCQLYSSSPRRFRFNIKDDMEFNTNIIIDIMYINSEPMVHCINKATVFRAAKFISSIESKIVWDAI